MHLDMVVDLAMDVNMVMDVDLAMETDLAMNSNWICTETCPWLLPWPWTWIAPDCSRIRFLIATFLGPNIPQNIKSMVVCNFPESKKTPA